jgi:acetolactate synthase-1/2/3 large subunit
LLAGQRSSRYTFHGFANRRVEAEMAGVRSDRTGGEVLVDQLRLHGARTAYCVPGESFLAILDAFYDRPDVRLINARHEAGAANMAEAYGKLTGEPGIAIVTRGPGACQASVGVHTAFQDSTPMILLVGQVARGTRDREAFQELDYREVFGGIAKWAAEIDEAARIPEYLARAFHVATSGRPGPVVLAIPEDVLAARTDAPDAARYVIAQPAIAPPELEPVRALLTAAHAPMILVGGPGWSDSAGAEVSTFAEANGLPIACSFRRQDIVDNRSPNFVGDLGTSGPPALVERMKEADLLIVIGARLGDMTTQGYTVLHVPRPRQKLVHVHASAEEIGRVFRPDVAIVSSSDAFAAAVGSCRWTAPERFAEWRAAARRDFEEAIAPPPYDPFDAARAMVALRDRLPDDAIVTVDAGNHSGWSQRYLLYHRPGRQIGPTSGAMAYSVPAAVAASLEYPQRMVVGSVGDGGFMMSGAEIATAVQHGGRPIILVFNNGMYGTIRMHQERDYPSRVVGTSLTNPDFVAMANAMGAHAERVERTSDFMPAFERAARAGKPAVIELCCDPDQVTTRTTISALRTGAR